MTLLVYLLNSTLCIVYCPHLVNYSDNTHQVGLDYIPQGVD